MSSSPAAPSVGANPPSARRTRRAEAPAAGLAPPRFAALIAAGVYALATLALGFPALAGQFLVNGRSDQFIAGYAFREFAASALQAGQGFPQWNPYLFGGMPYVAAMHGDIFYPTFLLRMILPADVAMTWGFIIHIFLCGLFTYAFLRAWGLGFFPSLIGGLAYMLSGQIASLVAPGHDGKLFVSALLPLALWMLVRGVRDGRAWAWGVLALAIGLAVLSPHPQLLQYMLLAAGAFAVFAAFSTHPDGTRLERPVAIRRLALALGSVVLGGAIGAIQFLPVRGYVSWSPRAGGKGWEHGTSFSMPIEEVLNTYLPQFSGMLDAYWGRNSIHFHSEYIGAAVFVLAAAAFGATTAPRRGFRWFWLGTLVVALFWAFGGHTPFYHLVWNVVPGTKFFRAPSIIFFLVSFSTAVLAALGMERVLEGRVSARYALGWIGGALLVALMATGGVFYGLGQSIAAGIPFEGVYERVLANRGAVVTGAWRSFLFAGGAAALLFALARGSTRRTAIAWGLVAIVGVDLWSIARHYWMFSPPASVSFATDPAIEHMARSPQPGRVLAAPLSDEGIVQPRDVNLRYDGLMTHDLRLLTGYHGNELGRYQDLAGDGDSYEQVGNPALWRLMNLRWIYTNASAMDSAFRRVVGPVKNSAGNTVYLYETPGDNPFAWVASAIVKAPDQGLPETLLDPRFNPRRVAVFDTAAAVNPRPLSGLPEPATTGVTVERYEPGHVVLALDRPAEAGQALVVSENYYPGWSATVDGRPATTARADFVLTGVELPAGGRRVELRFRDPNYDTGKMITLLALAGVAAAIAAGLVLDRRSRRV